jgi:short-subunit dehydrogenase
LDVGGPGPVRNAFVELPGSACLVTGARGGIGRAAVDALEAFGATVLTADRPASGAALEHDLAEPGAAERLAAEAGDVDVLVSNAGAGSFGDLSELDPGDVERLLRINLVAPAELTRALLPGMLARGRGHVVFVGSIVGAVGRPREAVYSAAKAGVAVFAESLRAELAGSGVGVSLVVPVAVDTGFFAARGAPYGRRRPRPVPPERVARELVDAIRRDRAEVVVPRLLAVPVRVHGAAPRLYRALARRFDRV